METIPSREAASRLATKKFCNILWNPKVHRRVQKLDPLFSVLSQLNAIHSTPFYHVKNRF
jgi:hypothetical protein